MDYTLAQYKPDTFELLAHSQTVDKLVTAFGYPSELYDFKFDWRYMMRGLIIDKVCVGLALPLLHSAGYNHRAAGFGCLHKQRNHPLLLAPCLHASSASRQ
eukprot:GHRQ01039324.1.p2 GENE.GHRQ01039324.1~~GHRQ01039324.1.p2  ORF type:complete len:101 (-),score=21.47 GHRQ01039324.1:100-402(-)